MSNYRRFSSIADCALILRQAVNEVDVSVAIYYEALWLGLEIDEAYARRMRVWWNNGLLVLSI